MTTYKTTDWNPPFFFMDVHPSNPALIQTQYKLQNKKNARFPALDIFRGLTLALMLLVNSPGNYETTYLQLLHASWHGWTFADTIFPTFLWIVGVAMVLSINSKLKKGISRWEIFIGVIRRSVILFLLGLFVNLFPKFNWETLRLMGVLQRIAPCYLFGSFLYLATGTAFRLLTIGALLVGYWALLFYVPVPGIGSGHLEMGQNLTHYIDHLALGVHNATRYKTWDPEELLGTLPALATLLLGGIAGQLLISDSSTTNKIKWFVLAGIGMLLLGLAWNESFPINKKLWTSSFVLFMAGLDFAIFGILLLLNQKNGFLNVCRPFTMLGMNAISIYVLSEIFEKVLRHTLQLHIVKLILSVLPDPYMASLVYAIGFVGFMLLIAYAMQRKRLFIRI